MLDDVQIPQKSSCSSLLDFIFQYHGFAPTLHFLLPYQLPWTTSLDRFRFSAIVLIKTIVQILSMACIILVTAYAMDNVNLEHKKTPNYFEAFFCRDDWTTVSLSYIVFLNYLPASFISRSPVRAHKFCALIV
jgi:hypothetical protein